MSNISPILSTNLNTSSLPPVFQIPQKMSRNDNINLSIHSKVNLKPIKNNKSNNTKEKEEEEEKSIKNGELINNFKLSENEEKELYFENFYN